MYDIIDIAKYFLSKNNDLTDKQVQKLVYYAYSWYIVANNESSDNIKNKLFQENPQAWIHGPVFNTLYREMKYNIKSFLVNDNYKKSIKESDKELLDLIYKVYGKYSGNGLEALTHSENPWILARNGLNEEEKSNNIIDDKVIFEYYNS